MAEHGGLELARAPGSLAEIDDNCRTVEAWAENCDSVPELQEASSRLAAIDEYLARTTTEGRARVAAAQRRLEVRIGQLLGPPETGRPRKDEEREGALHLSEVDKSQRRDLRRMAEHPDVVEDVIAKSDDERPASRRRVLREVDRKRLGVDPEEEERKRRSATLHSALEVLSTHPVTARAAAEEVPEVQRHRIDTHLDDAWEFLCAFREAWITNQKESQR